VQLRRFSKVKRIFGKTCVRLFRKVGLCEFSDLPFIKKRSREQDVLAAPVAADNLKIERLFKFASVRATWSRRPARCSGQGTGTLFVDKFDVTTLASTDAVEATVAPAALARPLAKGTDLVLDFPPNPVTTICDCVETGVFGCAGTGAVSTPSWR